MFDRHCSACDRTQLIFPSQITGVTNTEHGILVSYVCWCGSEQTWLTGAAGHVDRAAPSPPPDRPHRTISAARRGPYILGGLPGPGVPDRYAARPGSAPP